MPVAADPFLDLAAEKQNLYFRIFDQIRHIRRIELYADSEA